MPGNKFAVIRYRVIDGLLTNKYHKFPSLKRLSEECSKILYTEISPRTVREDIRAMKDDEGLGYFAPIKYSKSEEGYYYTDEKFSINKIPLSSADLEAVDYAAKLLGQFAGSINFKHYSGAIDRLLDSLSVNKKAADPTGFPFILFDKAPYFKGGDLLEQLVDIVKDHVVIQLGYLRFDSIEPHYYTLHPYCLKEYKSRWYIIGYIEERNDIRTFGLDRITEVKKLEKEFRLKKGFNPDVYFKYSFGITVGSGIPEKILLEFLYPQADYIKTQYLHETQQIISDSPTQLVIQLEVIPSFELKSMILSYGNQVKVLSPDWLAQEIHLVYTSISG